MRPNPGTTPSLRVAACISGMPKAIGTPRMHQHLRAVLQPLADASDVNLDVFVHLDGTTMDEWSVRYAARALGALNVVFYANSSMGEELPNLGDCQSRHERGACCKHGYALSVKLRGCLRDIEANERPPQRQYDFVLRLRPDIEHLHRLREREHSSNPRLEPVTRRRLPLPIDATRNSSTPPMTRRRL